MKTNWRYKLAQLRAVFGAGTDLDTIAAYQYKMPRSVYVERVKDTDGLYTVVVKKIDDNVLKNDLIITQGRNYPELVEMVNNAVLAYLEFPPEVSIAMPKLLPEGYLDDNAKPFGKQVEFARV